jgi:hypothetical protein
MSEFMHMNFCLLNMKLSLSNLRGQMRKASGFDLGITAKECPRIPDWQTMVVLTEHPLVITGGCMWV